MSIELVPAAPSRLLCVFRQRKPGLSLCRWPAGIVLGVALLTQPAWAFFGDDEARKAILDLRQKVDTNRAEADRRASQNSQEAAVLRQSLIDLSATLELLRAAVTGLQGRNEQLEREVSELQRMQKDAQNKLDQRLRQVEPVQVTYDGITFMAAPAEKADFEAAMESLRRGEFPLAADAYSAFLKRYPGSGYTAAVLYWLGNAQYANRAFLPAIETHRLLVSRFPAHSRSAEALLAVANSQVELKDTASAQRTLEELIAAYPRSEAAVAAADRLKRLR